MAATGNEVPLLSQLKLLKDWIVGQFESKLSAPSTIGDLNQVLTYQTSDSTGWKDVKSIIPDANGSTRGLLSAKNYKRITGSNASIIGNIPSIPDGGSISINFDYSTQSNYSGGLQYGSLIACIIDGKSDVIGFVSLKQTLSSLDNPLVLQADEYDWFPIPQSAVDIVRTTTHSTSYTKDTLEIVTDSTGKVTEMWFVTAD